MPYRWLLLDADGTLFDYHAAEAAGLEAAFARFGFAFDQAALLTYRRLNEAIWVELERGIITPERISVERFRRLFAALELAGDVEAFSARYLDALSLRGDLIEGALQVVQALHGHVGMALLTNGLARVQRSRLAHSSVAAYLRAVIISEEVGAAKPDPRIFAAALRSMGDPAPDEVLMVGDSYSADMRGACDYGLDACWFNPTGAPRDGALPIRYEIRRLRELLPIALGAPPH